MNKQEALKRIEAQKETIIELTGWAVFRYIETLIEQLDEPEKVKIPQFTADWIEYFKKTSDWDLFQAMDYLFEHTITCEWIETKDNQELFARAWIFGYEVEKEPKYKVKVKNTDDYLNETEVGFHFFNNSEKNKEFTRNELEYSDFAWVLDCPGIELEEVTE